MNNYINQFGAVTKSVYQAIAHRQTDLIDLILSEKIEAVDLEAEKAFLENIQAMFGAANNLKSTGTNFSELEDYEMTFLNFATLTFKNIINSIESQRKGENKFTSISFSGIEKTNELTPILVTFEIEALIKMENLDYDIDFLFSPMLIENENGKIVGIDFFGNKPVAPNFVNGNLVKTENVE